VKLDEITIAGMNGIEVPDGTQVDSEFVLSVRVRVFSMEREEIVVSDYAGTVDTLAGPLHAKLIALDGASVDAAVPA
jgi:hypothetical protein